MPQINLQAARSSDNDIAKSGIPHGGCYAI